jgi:hypothetical protein
MIAEAQDSPQHTKTTAGFLLFTLVVLSLVVLARPRYNGDLVGYVAAAVSFTESDPAVVHRMTYETIKSHIPPMAYTRITESSPHRHAISTTPALLQEFGGNYKARLLYVLPMYCLGRLGMPLPKAAQTVSLAMVCAAAGVLYVLAGRGLRGAAVVGLSALAFAWVEIASLATADSAALCAALLFIGALWKQSRWWWAAAALCLLARTDLILLIAFGIPFAPGSIRARLAGAVVLGGLYLLVTTSLACPSWRWQFVNDFLRQGQPTEGPIGFTWRLYVVVLLANLPQLLTWPTLAVMGFLAWANRPLNRAWLICCGIPFFFVAAHFVLYPALYPRFFGWCGAIMVARAVSLWSSRGAPVAADGTAQSWRDPSAFAAPDPRFNVNIPLPDLPPQPAGSTPSAGPGTGIDVSL